MSRQLDSQSLPPLWRLDKNPLILRYMRSQLRMRDVVVWACTMLLITAWVVFMMYGFVTRNGGTATDAARWAWMPLLVMQSFLLLFQGTSAVATGMVRESLDGMLNYQRLTPLTPLHKLIGYLFGLPIRNWLIFALTLPLSLWVIVQGQVELRIWLPIYSVLLSTAILYHLTGLLLGQVMPQGKAATSVATFLSYILVVLYLLLPNLGRFGLLLFEFLTIRPVMFHKYHEMDPTLLEGLPFVSRMIELDSTSGRSYGFVPFFGFEFSETFYTFLIQGILAASFALVILRNWRDAQANPLNKLWALLVGLGLQIILLGNALPLIAEGTYFNNELEIGPFKQIFAQEKEGVSPLDLKAGSENFNLPITRAYLISVVFGVVSLVLSAMLLYSAIASRARMISALRRSLHRKLQSIIPPLADEASVWWMVLALGLVSSAVWYYFSTQLFLAFPVQEMYPADQPRSSWGWLIWVIPSSTLVILSMLLETAHRRVWSVFSLLVWMLPTMAGSLMLVYGSSTDTWAIQLLAMSPLGHIFAVILPQETLLMDLWWAEPLANWAKVWIGFHAALAICLLGWRWRQGDLRRKKLQEEAKNHLNLQAHGKELNR